MFVFLFYFGREKSHSLKNIRQYFQMVRCHPKTLLFTHILLLFSILLMRELPGKQNNLTLLLPLTILLLSSVYLRLPFNKKRINISNAFSFPNISEMKPTHKTRSSNLSHICQICA